MDKKIELEYIGKISKDEYLELVKKLNAEGQFVKRKRRVSFMYFKDDIPKDIAKVTDNELDLRLRITDGQPEIVLKKGAFTGSHSRREIIIKFPIESIKEYIDFLIALGWCRGAIYSVSTIVFNYKSIEFSLIRIDDYGYNFEAEIIIAPEEEKEARKKIENELNALGLKPFNNDEINKQCNEINNRKELWFDFSVKSFDEIFLKFKQNYESDRR